VVTSALLTSLSCFCHFSSRSFLDQARLSTSCHNLKEAERDALPCLLLLRLRCRPGRREPGRSVSVHHKYCTISSIPNHLTTEWATFRFSRHSADRLRR